MRSVAQMYSQYSGAPSRRVRLSSPCHSSPRLTLLITNPLGLHSTRYRPSIRPRPFSRAHQAQIVIRRRPLYPLLGTLAARRRHVRRPRSSARRRRIPARRPRPANRARAARSGIGAPGARAAQKAGYGGARSASSERPARGAREEAQDEGRDEEAQAETDAPEEV